MRNSSEPNKYVICHSWKRSFPFLTKGSLNPSFFKNGDHREVGWVHERKNDENEIQTRGYFIIVLSVPSMLHFPSPESQVDGMEVFHDFTKKVSSPSFGDEFAGGVFPRDRTALKSPAMSRLLLRKVFCSSFKVCWTSWWKRWYSTSSFAEGLYSRCQLPWLSIYRQCQNLEQ